MAIKRVLVKTWSGRSEFQYEGSVTAGTVIHCGRDFRTPVEVPLGQYAALLKRFSGREVRLGCGRTGMPRNSVGEWITRKYRQDAMVSYIGPILIRENYAVRGSTSTYIRFKKISS